MKLSLANYKKSKQRRQVNLEELLEQCVEVLDNCEPNAQFEPLKQVIVSDAQILALKNYFDPEGEEGFWRQKNAIWAVVNTYNAAS